MSDMSDRSKRDRGSSRGVGVLPLALIAVGTLFLAFAAMLVFYVVPSQHKTPLELDGAIFAYGPADVLDNDSLDGPRLRSEDGVPIVYRQQATVVEPSDSESMSVVLGTIVYREGVPEDEGLISASLTTAAFDRVTAMPVGEGDNGTIAEEYGEPPVPVHVDGLMLKFPMNSEQTTYPFYDGTIRESQPIHFMDEAEIEGLDTYRFNQVIEPTDLSEVDEGNAFDVPASLVGLPGDEDVTVKIFYSVDKDYYVEPRTGTVVKAVERIDQWVGRTADERLVTAFKFDAILDDETVATQAQQAADGLQQLRLFGTILPAVLGGLGILAIAGGAVLGVRRSRDV